MRNSLRCPVTEGADAHFALLHRGEFGDSGSPGATRAVFLIRRQAADELQHDVDNERTMAFDRLARFEIALKEIAEGMAVGDLKPAERCDRHMEFDCIETSPEYASATAALEHVVDGVDNRHVDAPHSLHLVDVASP